MWRRALSFVQIYSPEINLGLQSLDVRHSIISELIGWGRINWQSESEIWR